MIGLALDSLVISGDPFKFNVQPNGTISLLWVNGTSIDKELPENDFKKLREFTKIKFVGLVIRRLSILKV